MRDIYQALSETEAKERLKIAVSKYEDKAPAFSKWLEENFEEGLAFYKYPRDHWKKIRTNNPAERLNEEFKRRTRVARLFPSIASCERLVGSVAIEIHEEWLSGKSYMSMEDNE